MENLFLQIRESVRFIAGVVVLVLIFGTTINAQSVQFDCLTTGESSPTSETDASYLPESTDKVKVIRIAFHIMQRTGANPQNFQANNSAHTAYIMDVFNRLNSLYEFCNVPACGGDYVQNSTFIRDSRIQFELQGIFYHADDVGFINEDGDYDNTYCEETYGICNVLDVYFCQLPGSTSGYGPGDWILLSNIYNEYINNGSSSWGNGNLLGHEIGHCFKIHHSWQCDQKARFSDICQGGVTTGCTGTDLNGPCSNSSDVDDGCHGSHKSYCQPSGTSSDWRCSNNMMSYAVHNDHISPLQMAAMHRGIININSAALKLDYDDTEDITIEDPNVIWDFGRVIYGYIYVDPGAKLTIRSKVLFSPQSRIVVKRGARLIIEGGHLSTAPPDVVDCGTTTVSNLWNGIEVWGNSAVTTTADMFEDNYAPQLNDPGAVILRKYQNQIPEIEHARVGVQTRRTNTTTKLEATQYANGLVKADDAKFLNCLKAADVVSYVLLDNASQFTDCEFVQNYLPSNSYDFGVHFKLSLKQPERLSFG